MGRTRLPRKASELQFKGKRPLGLSRTRWFNQVLQDIRIRRKSWYEIKKEKLWDNRKD
jgi:hypothetical protein